MSSSRSGTPKPRTFMHPPFLRLPDDVLSLILEQLEGDERESWPNQDFNSDLKTLCLVHRLLLEPVRAILYREPRFDADRKRVPALQAFAAALKSNPATGRHVKHLPFLGEHINGLYEQQLAPSIVSTLAIDILSRTLQLRTLSIPRVELRDQEKLVQAMTTMRNLQQVRLGVGCGRSKDGTPFWHEGDLRRIATFCPEVEELQVETANIHFAPTSGWVELFAFKNLRILTLLRATSFGDKQLLGLVTQAKKLDHLNLVGCLQQGTVDDDKPRLSRSGIAEVLERCGPRLKAFALDDSNLQATPKDDDGPIPLMEAALLHCTSLETLSLAGPGVIRPAFLSKLGRPPTPPPVTNYRMPPPPRATAAPALQHVTTLCLGLRPTPQQVLLDFVKALPLSTSPSSAPTDTVFPALKLLILNECTTRSQLPSTELDQRLAWLVDLRQAGAGKLARVVLKESIELDMPWMPRTAMPQMDAPRMKNRGFLSGAWLPDVKPLLSGNADLARFNRNAIRARALPVALPVVQPVVNTPPPVVNTPPPVQPATNVFPGSQPSAITPMQAAARAALARAHTATLQQQQAISNSDTSQPVVGASTAVQASSATEDDGETTEGDD
ncbi:hypothetical protein BCR35DRAFT_308399 [Leucosporidium creatinivorum]|uniref:Uncharacterized protein n=1 Tax=Leucosporidium creatinivorum TaxID=106004 RepID=A0A1Y2E6J3_9BASI|nr:hypothetical protein BCR35DRAFT_308399 [Leucosporidium creatinivorum]